ncbi:MAG: PIN domain-containing protein [Anaerolineales bacterium]
MMLELYLDTCCFNRPFDDQTKLSLRLETEAKLQIQTAIRAGTYHLNWSYILNYENMLNPQIERCKEIAKWESLAHRVVLETSDVLTSARKMGTLGFRALDALHLGCAIALRCDYFLTVDKGILKKSAKLSEIRVRNPVDFVFEQGL